MNEKKDVSKMTVKNRPLQIAGGVLALFFGAIYLACWLASLFIFAVLPWGSLLYLIPFQITFGVAFLLGLVMILIGMILKDYLVITYMGGIFTIICSVIFVFLSLPLANFLVNPLWFAWLFIPIMIVGTILFLVGGHQDIGATPGEVARILHSL
jgi:hypothetical protein